MILWWVLLAILVVYFLPLAIARHRRQPMNKAARAEAPGKFAKLPSGRTYYEWHGPLKGPIAVCIHGLTTPSYVWRAVESGLKMMGYRVLTYDLYGRGYSGRALGRQNADFFITQLEELLEDQGIDGGIMLLGYSMGGAIATCYAAKHPDMLERLILIAPAGLGIKSNKLQDFIIKTPVIGDWIMRVFGGHMIRKAVKAESSIPSEVPDIYDRQIADTYVRGFLPAVLSSLRNILSKPLDEEHRKIAKTGLPVAAIWGEKDKVIPITGLGKLTKLNRNVRQTMVEGATHSLVYTRPKDVIKAIQEFLREV